jgi:hypothetical protein
VVRSRQTLAFLRGPLTRKEVAQLGDGGTFARATPLARWVPAPSAIHDGVATCFLAAAAAARCGLRAPDGERSAPEDVPQGRVAHRPALHVRLRLRFSAPGWSVERTVERVAFPLDHADTPPRPLGLPGPALSPTPPEHAVFERLPPWVADGDSLRGWLRAVLAEVASSEVAVRLRHPRIGIAQSPSEDRVAFEARVASHGGTGAIEEIVPCTVRVVPGDLGVDQVALVWVAVT